MDYIISILSLFKGIAPKNKMLGVSFYFLTAEYICGYLGILVLGKGVFDFLYFKLLGGIIFDLKDMYINCYIVLLIISTMKTENEHKIKLKDMVSYLKALFK